MTMSKSLTEFMKRASLLLDYKLRKTRLSHPPLKSKITLVDERDGKKNYRSYRRMIERLEGSDWPRTRTLQDTDGMVVVQFRKGGRPLYLARSETPKKIKRSSEWKSPERHSCPPKKPFREQGEPFATTTSRSWTANRR